MTKRHPGLADQCSLIPVDHAMLPVLISFHDDEPLLSLASRLANANGVGSMADLLADLGIPFWPFLLGETDPVDRFAALAGIDPDLARRRSTISNGADEISFENLSLKTKWLFRNECRACPACLRDDMGGQFDWKTRSKPFMRSV